MTALLIGILIGLSVGALLVYFIMTTQLARNLSSRDAQLSSLTTQLSERNSEIENARIRTAVLETDLSATREVAAAQRARVASLEAELKAERDTGAEKLALLENAEQRLRDAFAALSSESLRISSKQFLQLAETRFTTQKEAAEAELANRQKAVEALVEPLGKSLEKQEHLLREIETTRTTDFAGLRQQLINLSSVARDMNRSADGLSQALRNPQARGRWGELQLRRVVELAGMSEHCDFAEQTGATTESGRQRPDLLVRLPGGRQIPVDAKTPIQAYLEAAAEADPDRQSTKLIEHAEFVKRQIENLARKDYQAQFASEGIEFVVMFLPAEQFLTAALREKPEMMEWAMEKRVLIATPPTLIAILRAMAYGWQQDRLQEKAQEIADAGRELYERLTTLASHFASHGNNLEKSIESYNQFIGSLERMVLPSARKLRELAAITGKEASEPSIIEKSVRQTATPELRSPLLELDPGEKKGA